MKKTLKKVILTLAAVAMTATMAISAMAAVTVDSTVAEDKSSVAVTVAGIDGAKQVTILILKPGTDDTAINEDSIYYINQEAANADGSYTFNVALPADVADGTYTVKVGGEDVAADGIGVDEIVIGEGGEGGNTEFTGKIGDVDANDKINGTDSLQILQFSVEKRTEFKCGDAKVADVDNNGKINGTDALQILQFSVEKRTEFARKDLSKELS